MNKLLALFLSLSIWITALAQGDPPPYVKGQSASGLGNLGSTIQVPKNQSTKLNSYQARIETGNTNELRNPSFEGSPYNSGWVCPTGTISQAVGPDGFKALGIVSSGAGFECNQTFTSTADLKGTLARFFARVKTSAPNTFVCGLDGGSSAGNRVNCQKVILTSADKVFSETSGFFNYGNMVYGIAIYSTDTAAFPTVIDDASMGAAGLTTATIQGDTVYTAKVSSTGVVSDENVDFINGNCVMSGTNSAIGTCTFNSLKYSQSPNCLVSAVTTGAINATIHTPATISGFSFYGYNTTNATNSAIAVNIACFKQGADYANSSSSGILSSNADFGMTPVTVTGSWNTNTTYSAIWSRKGERAYFEVLVTNTGAPNSTGLIINLPVTIDDSKVITTNSSKSIFGDARHSDATGAGRVVGSVGRNNSTSVAVYHLTNASNAETNTNQTLPFVFATGDTITLKFDVPVLGWTQSPLAIIPLAGTATVPGYSGQVEKTTVSYGATASTVCSSGVCAYLDQPGNGVSSITKIATGRYTAQYSKTCSKLKLTGNAIAPANFAVLYGTGCNNCNSITFDTGSAGSVNTSIDTYGTVEITCTY